EGSAWRNRAGVAGATGGKHEAKRVVHARQFSGDRPALPPRYSSACVESDAPAGSDAATPKTGIGSASSGGSASRRLSPFDHRYASSKMRPSRPSAATISRDIG